MISRTDSGGAQEYYLTDGLGSTIGLADGTGAVTTATRTTCAVRCGRGQRHERQRVHVHARYYDPATGRFASRDPLPLMQRYAYVDGNPVNYADPRGLCPLCEWAQNAWECVANGGDCVDPRQIIDPLIELLPDCRFPAPHPHVSCQLAATCLLFPEACAAAAKATAIAQLWSLKYYGTIEPPEGTRANPKEGDAFIHCYWSGLIALQVGASKAEKITTRFEAYAGNPPDQRDYDIDNNTRGREFAQRFAAPDPMGLAVDVAAESALRGYCRG